MSPENHATDRRALCLATLPLVVLASWIAIGERGPRALPLPDSVELPTVVAACVACLALSAALALCAWRQLLGLAMLGVVLVGIGVFWISLQGPPISGSLVWSSGSHGIHANDWWGLIPIGAGVAAWVWAWRSRPGAASRRRGQRQMDVAATVSGDERS